MEIDSEGLKKAEEYFLQQRIIGEELKKHEFMIGGYDSKIPGRLAYNAPLGKAILNKKAGETIEVHIGPNQKTVYIQEIR